MTDTASAPTPPKRRRWLRWLAGIVGVLIILLVALYFVATSAAFLKGFILPKASAALNAQITVADASVSPFSHVELRGLKVQTTGPEPLLTAQQVLLRYSLSDMLRGNYRVEEIKLVSPVVNVVENPDGTSNLDPLLKPQPGKAKPETPAKPELPTAAVKPPQIELQQLSLTDGILRRVKLYKGGGRDVMEISPLNLNLTNVRNGETGKLEVSATAALDQNPPAPGTNAQLQAKLAGQFTFGLTADLKPDAVKGNLRCDVTKAGGSLAQIGGLAVTLDCDATPKEVKGVALRFLRNNAGLGEVRVRGPLDLDKNEGRLNVEILSLDRQVLNLAGAPMGMDFNQTVINATNQIELAKSASVITIAGRLNLDRFSVTRTNQTTPPLDLRAGYNVVVDQPQKSALLREFSIDGAQGERPLLLARLAQPMSFAWGNTNQALPDSSLSLIVTNFNLADWRAFTGDAASAGTANLTVDLSSRNAGKSVAFDCASLVDGLAARFGSNTIAQATVRLRARGQVEQLNQVNLAESRFELARQGQALMSASAAGQIALDTKDADVQLTLDAVLARLLELAPQPNATVSAGAANVKAHVTQKSQVQTVAGTFTLSDFTGAFGTNQLAKLGAAIELDLTKRNDQVQIRKAAGTLRQGANPAANFEVSGSVTLGTNQPQADLQLALEAMLPQLLQAAPQPDIKATVGTARLKAHVVQQGKAQSVEGTLGLAGFTGNFREYKLNDFSATFAIDASQQDQQVQLRKCSGTLSAGNQPGGSFELKGTVGLTNQAGQIELQLTDLNQNALRPFLAASLGEKQLASVHLNAQASVQYDLQRESAIKGDAAMTNLVVNDPRGGSAAMPLEAKLQLDTVLKQKQLDLRQCVLTLTPTKRARNAVELKGQVDFSRTNALQGALKLASEAFDVTPYYDLFASKPATNAPAKPPAQAQAQAPEPPAVAAPASASAEPPPVKLPIQQFTLDANVGHFYLREMDLANIQAGLKLDASNVVINPLQLAVNGGPVNGNIALNLGVPGYQYDLALKGGQVPLAPLANSFAPDYKDRAKGELAWNVSVQGAGTTGASLQKSLRGAIDFTLTNASVVLTSGSNGLARFMRTVIQPLASALRLPELSESPLTLAETHVGMGEGKINIDKFQLVSDAFTAGTQGSIPINEVLTNSPLPNLPVNLSIRRDLMQRIKLVPRDVPPEARYVQLPALYRVGGTVGKPDPKFDAAALGMFAARVATGMPGLQGGSAGNLVQGFSQMLGNKPGATNAPATNAAPSAGGGLFQGMQGLLGGNKSPATNAASTNAPATNAPPAFNPFDLFKKK